MDAAEMGRLLTRHVAADRLGISTATLGRLIRSGEIAAIQVGKRSVRVAEAEIAAYLLRRATGQQQQQ